MRYEDDGAEEWLRLNDASFNNRARGSWRVDLDFEATAAGSGPAGEAGDGDDAESAATARAATRRTRMTWRTRRTRTRIKMRKGAIKRKEKT